MQIRPLEEKDNPATAKMIRRIFDEHNAPRRGTVYSDPTTDGLFSVFQRPNSVFYIAESENKIVGCCGIYPTPGLPKNCAELVKFYISARARGKGIGKELMQKSILAAKQFGYTQIYLESLPQFAKAVSIYEKQGFVKINTPMGNSGHSGCNIWMLKEL